MTFRQRIAESLQSGWLGAVCWLVLLGLAGWKAVELLVLAIRKLL